jgi:hypothetical protein
MRFAFLLQGWGIASPMFGRISFCLFLLRIFSSNDREKHLGYTLWFAIVSQAAVNVATIFIIYTQCGRHPEALWDASVHATCLAPEVQTNFSYFQSGKVYPVARGFLLTLHSVEFFYRPLLNHPSSNDA